MDDRLVLRLEKDDILLLQETVKVLPIVELLLKLEAVIELVHLDLLGVVARQDLGVDPAVGEIALRVGDLVSQIE